MTKSEDLTAPKKGGKVTLFPSPGSAPVFVEGGKPENQEKKPRSTGENQQTQLTYDAGSGNRTRDHNGERRHSVLPMIL